MTKKPSRKTQEFTRPTPAHVRQHSGPRFARILSLVLVGVLGLGTSMAAAVNWKINSSMTKIDPKKYVSKPVEPKDPRAGESLNILVMGSDTREGENSELVGDGEGGQRSDTTMILHVSSDRSRVEVISIPRDTMLPRPACRIGEDKYTQASDYTQFNDAYSVGWSQGGGAVFAAACVVETIQHNTGLTIDHTVIVNFDGFVNMVEALGGIEIDIPETLYSKKAGDLCLVEGTQKIDGKTALKLVRARSGTGWGLEIGSDLKRIERQQAVLSATIATALKTNLVTDLDKLTSFVTASLKSLTVDNDFDANAIIALAWALKDIDLENVEFYGAPVVTDPANKNRVVFTAETSEYWEKLKLDQPIAAAEPDEETSVSASPTDATSTSDSDTKDSTTDGTATDTTATPDTSASATQTSEPEQTKVPKPTKTKATSSVDCNS